MSPNTCKHVQTCPKTLKRIWKHLKMFKNIEEIPKNPKISENVRMHRNAFKRIRTWSERVRMHPRTYDNAKKPTKNFKNWKKIARIFSEAPLVTPVLFFNAKVLRTCTAWACASWPCSHRTPINAASWTVRLRINLALEYLVCLELSMSNEN